MALIPLESEKEFDNRFSSGDRTWIFKHSNACPVSSFAQVEVDRYLEEHPDVDVLRVVVQTHRSTSNHIETATGVRHESPQALLVRDGVVLWNASHGDITADSMASARDAASDHR
ncbi:MAG: bacillithiol system redox-active protein YtxJ [Planctomycetota bacterium]|jgi:bacillithiol system protein YtxJ